MASESSFRRRKARSIIHALVRALKGVGYDEASAFEIAGCLIEEAAKDGIDTQYLMAVMDQISPIRKNA